MGLSVEPQRLNWLLTGPNKTYKVSPNKGNELSIAARKQRSKRFRAVSEQRTRSESQRPGEKWHE